MDNNPIRYEDFLGDTAIVTWHSGFLGLGKKHEARYVGNQWIDSKSRATINRKDVSRNWVQNKMKDYTTLNGDKNFNDVTSAINNAKNSINLMNGGAPSTDAPKYFKDLINGTANPDIDVHTQGTETLPSQLFGTKGDQNTPSYIVLGHELGHVYDLLNSGGNTANFTQIKGLDPGISNSEVNAMYWENVLRQDAHLPLRLWYNYSSQSNPQFQLKANVITLPTIFGGSLRVISDLNKTHSQSGF